MAEFEHEAYSVNGYMCKIDFECELGAAMGGNTVYPSVEDLKRHHPHWEQCGIVEVKVSFVNLTVPDDLYSLIDNENDNSKMTDFEYKNCCELHSHGDTYCPLSDEACPHE